MPVTLEQLAATPSRRLLEPETPLYKAPPRTTVPTLEELAMGEPPEPKPTIGQRIRGLAGGISDVADRFVIEAYNEFPAAVAHALGGPDVDPAAAHAWNAQQRRIKGRSYRLNRNLLDDEFDDIVRQLYLPSAARESTDLRDLPQFTPRVNPFAVELGRPKNLPVKIGGIAGQFTGVAGKIGLARTILGPGASDPAVWEAASFASGEPVGKGASMGAVFGWIKGIPAISKVGKAAKIGAESGALGGMTAISGGDTEDIIISSLIPIAFAGYGAAKGRMSDTAMVKQWRENLPFTRDIDYKASLKMARAMRANWEVQQTKDPRLREQQLRQAYREYGPVVDDFLKQADIAYKTTHPQPEPTEPPRTIRGLLTAPPVQEPMPAPPKPIRRPPPVTEIPAKDKGVVGQELLYGGVKPSVTPSEITPTMALELLNLPETFPTTPKEEIVAPAPPEPLPTVLPPKTIEPPKTLEEMAEKPPDIRPEVSPIVEIPVKTVKYSKDLPNFKGRASRQTGIIAEDRLQGKYERLGTGAIVVWERIDGSRLVGSGKHRFDLAQRNREETIPAQILKESEGWTRQMVMILDAEANIRDGQGSVKDYASYFRNTEISKDVAREKGLLSRAKGNTGWDIGKSAGDDVFTQFVNGKITEAKAAAIARGAPNQDRPQQLGLMKSEEMNADELEDFVRMTARLTPSDLLKPRQSNLFGYDESAIEEEEAVVKQVSKERASIKDRILAVKGALKRPTQARKMGLEFSDEAAIAAEVGRLESRLDALTRVGTTPELYREMMTRAGLTAPTPTVTTPNAELQARQDYELNTLRPQMEKKITDLQQRIKTLRLSPKIIDQKAATVLEKQAAVLEEKMFYLGKTQQPVPTISTTPTGTTPQGEIAAEKQTWEMTRGEYAKTKQDVLIDTEETLRQELQYKQDTLKAGKGELGVKLSKDTIASLQHSINRYKEKLNLSGQHQQIIQQALSEGKSVPPAVLAEYPDLAKPAPAAEKAEVLWHASRGKLDIAKKFDISDYPDGLDLMDYMGIHLGTKKAARQRTKSDLFEGEKAVVSSFTAEIKKPFGNKVWQEDELREAIRKYGQRQGITSDKNTARRAKEEMRKEGYDGILYYNTEEDPGSISKIVFGKDQLQPAPAAEKQIWQILNSRGHQVGKTNYPSREAAQTALEKRITSPVARTQFSVEQAPGRTPTLINAQTGKVIVTPPTISVQAEKPVPVEQAKWLTKKVRYNNQVMTEQEYLDALRRGGFVATAEPKGGLDKYRAEKGIDSYTLTAQEYNYLVKQAPAPEGKEAAPDLAAINLIYRDAVPPTDVPTKVALQQAVAQALNEDARKIMASKRKYKGLKNEQQLYDQQFANKPELFIKPDNPIPEMRAAWTIATRGKGLFGGTFAPGFDRITPIVLDSAINQGQRLARGAKNIQQAASFYTGRAAAVLEKHYGDDGKQMARDTREIDFQAARRYAGQNKDLEKNLKSLSYKDRKNLTLMGLPEGKVDPKTKARLAEVEQKVRHIMDSDMHAAGAVGYKRWLVEGEWRDIQGSGKWAPHVLNKTGRQAIQELHQQGKGSPRIKAAIEQMVEEGKAQSEDEAYAKLLDWSQKRLRGTHGYFEMTRVPLPESWLELDAGKILPPLLHKNAYMIEAARIWGLDKPEIQAEQQKMPWAGGEGEPTIQFTKAQALIKQIGLKYGSNHANALTKWLRTNFGLSNDLPDAVENTINAINHYLTITRLGLSIPSPIRNLTQGNVNLFSAPLSAHFGAINTQAMKPWSHAAQKLYDDAYRAGAVLGRKEMTETEFLRKGREPISMKLFGASEESNHYRAALIAARSAEKHIVDLATRREGTALSKLLIHLKYASFRPETYLRDLLQNRTFTNPITDAELDEVLKRPLTLDEVQRIMHRASVDTQFIQNLSTRPIPWKTSPWVRTGLKFKTFGIHQTRLVWEEAIKQALKGTFAPLLKYLLLATIGGEVYNIARDLIVGGDTSITSSMINRPEKRTAADVAAMLVNDFIDGAGVGIITDLTWGIGSFLGGPIGQTVQNARKAGANWQHPLLAARQFFRNELAAARQLDPLLSRADALFFNENNNYFAHRRWRDRAYDFKVKAGYYTGRKTGIGPRAARQVKEFFIGRPTYDINLPYKYAADQVTIGDINDAADYLAAHIKDNPQKSFTDLRTSIDASMRAHAPFAGIADKDLPKFLSQFDAKTRAEGISVQQKWIEDYRTAKRIAFDRVRR